ncbi:MAG: orotate phosphoribosyltransferase [Planctomycetota bacterium]|jgi:orotate phosphoribosyltransferase|nr:orotate phosphoribosyltransferase [Planctomycetota bacterium]
MSDRETLRKLIDKLAIQRGEFTLVSGAKASYYIDCRKVTLDSCGANLIGKLIYEKLLQGDFPEAAGGMAIGADPITGSVVAYAGSRDRQLSGFIVRKEAKTHGTGKMVEGPIVAGQSAVILEDVVTSGGSSLKAIQLAQDAGLVIKGVICIVDRLAGGREVFEKEGYSLESLFTIEDFGLAN